MWLGIWALYYLYFTRSSYLLKASAHSLKRFTSPQFSNYLSLSMHLLHWMNVMIEIIWTLPVQLRGARNKWTLQKIVFIVGFEPLHGKETCLQVHRLNRSAKSRLLWMKKLNIQCLLVCISIRSINKLEHSIGSAVAAFPWYNICIV